MLNLPSYVFGYATFVHSHNPHRRKLDPRVVKHIFLVIPQIKMDLCYHPPSCWVFVLMDGESYLEVELVIESLPFPTQDDVQVQEVTKPTLVLEQAQLSEPEVSIPENPIEDVIDDMPIALRKGKQSCVKYPIS
ncbi:hypothetical protein CR513_61512, partial [Mucuna pruriens]